eukprot:UN00150
MSQPQDDSFTLPPVVFILGGPGSGKGTQCEQLLKAVEEGKTPGLPNKVTHVNVGGLLRDAQAEYRQQLKDNNVSPAMAKAGPVLEEMLAIGAILPSWVTVTLLREQLRKISIDTDEQRKVNPNFSAGVLIDGFPRSTENLESYESIIGTARRLIVLDVPAEEMVQRILARSKFSGREDDASEATVRKRLAVFDSQTAETMRSFTIVENAEEALKVADEKRVGIKINGNRPIDVVTPEFMNAFITLSSKL